MKFDRSTYLLLCLFIGSNTLFSSIMNTDERLLAAGLQLSTVILLCLVRPLLGFALLVIELLGLGFILTGASFIEGWSGDFQLVIAIKLLVFIVTIGLIWLLVLQIKNLQLKLNFHEFTLSKLKKYEADNSVLTVNEFLYQAETMQVSMRRRKEKGFFLRIILNLHGHNYALRTVNEHLCQVALDSIRLKYDIVGKLSEQELLILLQNTNQTGATIVANRFQEKLKNVINLPETSLIVKIAPMPEDWQQAHLMISGTVLPTRRERKHQFVERL